MSVHLVYLLAYSPLLVAEISAGVSPKNVEGLVGPIPTRGCERFSRTSGPSIE